MESKGVKLKKTHVLTNDHFNTVIVFPIKLWNPSPSSWFLSVNLCFTERPDHPHLSCYHWTARKGEDGSVTKVNRTGNSEARWSLEVATKDPMSRGTWGAGCRDHRPPDLGGQPAICALSPQWGLPTGWWHDLRKMEPSCLGNKSSLQPERS